MTWVAVAVGGAALVGGIASGVIGANAAGSAANSQAQSAQNSLQLQQSMFNKVQGNLQPYMDFGSGQLTQLNALLGKGGDPAQMQRTLQGMPGYQFTLGQGLKSVQNSAAARGLGSSGAALKGAATYATGLANSQYNSYFNQLLGSASLGENAAAGFGNNATNASANMGSTIQAIGNAQAAGTLGQANAYNNALSSAGNSALGGAYLYNQHINGGGNPMLNNPGIDYSGAFSNYGGT